MTKGDPNRKGASRVVRAVTCLLPAGPTRDGYRQEFVAEMRGLDRISRILFIVGLVGTSFALRAALRNPATPPDGPTLTVPSKPLLCRTNLHHRWRTHLNPDGEPYRHCVRCGADRFDGIGRNNTAGNVAGNMVMPGW